MKPNTEEEGKISIISDDAGVISSPTGTKGSMNFAETVKYESCMAAAVQFISRKYFTILVYGKVFSISECTRICTGRIACWCHMRHLGIV